MSIVELVVAFAILMVVLVPIALLLSNVIGQAATSRERLTALSIAEQYLDLLNNTPLDGTHNQTPNDTTLPIVGKTLQQTSSALLRSTVSYTVFARFTWAVHEGTLDLCTSGEAPTLLNLRVTVKWSHHETQQITDTTMIDYPPSGIVTDGFVAVKVDGDPASGPPSDEGGHSWSDRVQAVPVTITPESTVTGYTTTTRYPNQYGCVFQEVPPGKYQLSVADPSPGTPAGSDYGTPSWAANYDEERSETAPSPASVTVGGVTTVTFQYDEGSLVDVTYPSTTAAEGDVTCPDAGSILCMATGQSPTSATAPAGTSTADVAVLTSKGWTVYQPAATRLVATACAGTARCVSVGYRKTGSTYVGASVSATTTTLVELSSDTVPSGVMALQGISCPTKAKCYAYGEGATTSKAVILSAAVGTGALAWKADAGLTNVAQITTLTCTGATTCDAIGTTATNGPVVLSLAATGSSWTTDTIPSSPTANAVTSVSHLACHGAACYVTGADASGAVILSPKTAAPTTWAEDTIPATTQLSALTCPSATVCFAAGTESASAEVLSITSTTGTTVKWKADTVASGLTSLSVVKCPGTSRCYAVGTSASGPAIASLTSGTKWTKDTLPSTMDSISALTCATTTACSATGTTTVSGRVISVVLSISATSATTWHQDTLPSGVAPVYFAGVACTSAGARCAAPGATDTGAIFLSATLTGTTWTNGTPAGLTGLYLADTPVSVYNAELSPSSALEVASPAPANGDVSSVGPLFPFASGYEVAAAGCSTQMTATAIVSSVPGGTAKTALPMGLLPIEVKNATGTAPVSGATVSVKLNCTRLTPPSGSTTQTTFSLEATGPLGLSETAVMYGSYKVTVASGGTTAPAVTVTVTETGTKVGGITTPLPTPVVIDL